MTFVLGARCKDGVVVIGDTHLSVRCDFAYGYKLFSVFPGIVIAFAGDKALLELFKSNFLDFIKSQGLINNPVSSQRALFLTSKISRQISDKYGRHYDILLATSGTLFGGTSSLRWLAPTGESMPISDYCKLGSDTPHATVFLKKLFRPDMSMQQGAELGYFIIKYLERFELGLERGLDLIPPFDKPVIWFVPDAAPDQLLTDRKILDRFESNSIERLDKLETNIVKSYGLC